MSRPGRALIIAQRAATVAAWAFAASVAAAPVVAAQDGVGFRASIGPDTVYVGQQALYSLTVSLPAEVRQRLRRNPVFVPPEARAMLAYELPMSKGDPTREGSEVHVFRRALFPLTPGRYQIAPSQLTYALPQSPSFFSREEERTLRSESVTLVAIDPPLVGRPSAWLGAVGRWRVTARTDAREGRVGDPLVLTLRVEGIGNATLLPRPALAVTWADVVAEDERVTLDTTPNALGGSKEFSWLLTPRTAGAREVPAVEFVFFDPGTRRYEVARTVPIALRVREGDYVSITRAAGATGRDSALALRPALEGPRPLTLPRLALWGWLALAAPLPWAFLAFRRRRPKPVRPLTAAERLARPGSAEQGALRTLFEAALRDRTGVRLDRETAPGALSAALRREGVTAETAKDAEYLRDALDQASYARGARPADHRDRVRALLDRVAKEARAKGALLLLAGALMLGARLTAQGANEALAAFSEGQTAYLGRDFARARDAFLRASRAAPRDPAAWANLGTAAWQAGDTASAVLGWQRALRLDPMAADLRPRLARARAPQDRGAALVLPVPPLPMAALALVLWCAAWGVLALRARRGPAGAHWLLLIPSVALIAVAAVLEGRLRADDLLVVATATPLRALPALGAEPGAVPLVGEVVTVRERRGVWVRISLEAGREGWYPVERTYPLQRD
ncbi:MAG: BatD family protein [Gemmatimonadaceae bacterium]|nr:BatD family protein [Gemmatimonadaceae bacterium]